MDVGHKKGKTIRREFFLLGKVLEEGCHAEALCKEHGIYHAVVCSPAANHLLLESKNDFTRIPIAEELGWITYKINDDTDIKCPINITKELSQNEDPLFIIKVLNSNSKFVHAHKHVLDTPKRSDFPKIVPTITMFIKVSLSDNELFCTKSNTEFHKHGFLLMNRDEQFNDYSLQHKYSRIFEVINDNLEENQTSAYLRQFINDDKGVVAICNVFLDPDRVRTREIEDAINIAKNINVGLLTLGVVSSIGIALSDCYCGHISNEHRSEFTVIGSGVNLSARLMAKASSGEILCDADMCSGITMIHDKSATYSLKGFEGLKTAFCFMDDIENFTSSFDKYGKVNRTSL